MVFGCRCNDAPEISSHTQEYIIGSVFRLWYFLKPRVTHTAKCDDEMVQVGEMKIALWEVWVQHS